MKIFKRTCSLLLCYVIISSVTCFITSAKTIYTDGDWSYVMNSDYTQFEIDSFKGTGKIASTIQRYNSIPIVSINSYAFSNNANVTEVRVNSPITSIQNYVFLDCVNLETVTLSDTVENIGVYSFAGCSSLKTINLENTRISEVKKGSFQECTVLQQVIIPDTVTTIGDLAFASCHSLSKIIIPDTVTAISSTAFKYSENVVIYCYEDSTAHLFAEENSIEYVLLDPPVTYILGDVDNSGEVSILDATEVQLLIAMLVEPQDEYTQLRADIDSDGVLSIMDATSIQMYIAGYEVEEPIGETFEV